MSSNSGVRIKSSFKRWQGRKMPQGVFSTGHSTQLGAAFTPGQANHVLEPLHINTGTFSPLEQTSVHQKKHLFCPSVCRWKRICWATPVTKPVKYLSATLVKCLQSVGTAANLLLVTRWLFSTSVDNDKSRRDCAFFLFSWGVDR